MKSNKWILGLLTMVLILALAPNSSAQVQILLSNPASAAEVATNHMAQSADPTSAGNGLTVSGQLIAVASLTTTTLVITYPGPLTSTTAPYTVNGATIAAGIPSTDPIQLQGASGLFATAYITTFNGPKGTINIVLPGGTAATSGSFRLIGVHFDVNGLTAPLTATAVLNSSANGYIQASPTSFPIVTALPAGIASVNTGFVTGGTNGGSLLFFTNGSTAAATASFVLTEGCATCWRNPIESSTDGTAVSNGTQVRLTVNGIPAGVTLSPTFTAPSKASIGGTFSNGSLKANSGSSTTNNQTIITLTGDDLTKTETFQITLTATGTSTQTTAGPITVTASMAPVGTGVDAAATPTANVVDATSYAVGYPVFTAAEVGPLTIGNVAAASTTLLVPYVVSVAGYDTGIEIANTTADPFGATGFGATATNGALSFTIYSDNATRTGSATPITVTSSSTKIFGQGLDSSGNLDAGSVWTGSITSDILPAAGATVPTGGFFGYVFITANFLDAHGISLVYNGAGTSYGAPLLVVPPVSSGANRSSPTGGAETLNN